MEVNETNNLACTLIPKTDQIEKDALWEELKNAFISRKSLRKGYRLKFKAPPNLLDKMGRLISLERTCCSFLHIRMDVPPPVAGQDDTMEISLIGDRGVKDFLEPSLSSMGFGTISQNNRLLKAGAIGVIFSILCCTLPIIFLALGMTGIASVFLALDSVMWLILPLSFIALAYGIYKKRKNSSSCGKSC